MRSALDEAYEKVQQLTLRDRATLIQRLIANLDGPAEADVEQAWIEEADRRLDAHDRGDVKAIPADQVRREIKQRNLR